MTSQILSEAEKSGFIFNSTRKHCEELLSLESIPEWAKFSIEELIKHENWTELNDSFTSTLLEQAV